MVRIVMSSQSFHQEHRGGSGLVYVVRSLEHKAVKIGYTGTNSLKYRVRQLRGWGWTDGRAFPFSNRQAARRVERTALFILGGVYGVQPFCTKHQVGVGWTETLPEDKEETVELIINSYGRFPQSAWPQVDDFLNVSGFSR